jgi:hypothetical protein
LFKKNKKLSKDLLKYKIKYFYLDQKYKKTKYELTEKNRKKYKTLIEKNKLIKLLKKQISFLKKFIVNQKKNIDKNDYRYYLDNLRKLKY